jgi:hypothetical protein
MDFNLFNLQTQKKTQNIHNNNNNNTNNNNNKKKKGRNFWRERERESHSRLVQIPLLELTLSNNTYTPSLPIARTRKSLPKKLQCQNTIKLSKAPNFPKCRY